MGMSINDAYKLHKFILRHGISNIKYTYDNLKREYAYVLKRTITDNEFWDDKNDEQLKGHKYDFGSPFRYGRYKKSGLVREIIEIADGEVIQQTREYQSIFKNGFAGNICSLYQKKKDSSGYKIKIPIYSFIDKTYTDKTLKQSLTERYILYFKMTKFLYHKKQQGIVLFTKGKSQLTDDGYNAIRELIPLCNGQAFL